MYNKIYMYVYIVFYNINNTHMCKKQFLYIKFLISIKLFLSYLYIFFTF